MKYETLEHCELLLSKIFKTKEVWEVIVFVTYFIHSHLRKNYKSLLGKIIYLLEIKLSKLLLEPMIIMVWGVTIGCRNLTLKQNNNVHILGVMIMVIHVTVHKMD